MKLLVIPITILLLSSCDNRQEYIDERIDILNNTPFDPEVINNINFFEKIREILIQNKEEFVGGREKGYSTR
jgi:hypothetical protein